MIRFLLKPSLLLEQTADAVVEFISTLEYKQQDDSIVAIMMKHVANTPSIQKLKILICENQTAVGEYVEEYVSRTWALDEALDEPIPNSIDTQGPILDSVLKTIWRLKSLNIESLLDGVEQRTVIKISLYVEQMLKYASEHAVSDSFCKGCSQHLAEASLTFGGTQTLLDLQATVGIEIENARKTGSRTSFANANTEFLKNKTVDNFEKFIAIVPSMHGVPLTDTTKINTTVHVIMEDAAKMFPAKSTYGPSALDAMDTLCSRYLKNNVFP